MTSLYLRRTARPLDEALPAIRTARLDLVRRFLAAFYGARS